MRWARFLFAWRHILFSWWWFLLLWWPLLQLRAFSFRHIIWKFLHEISSWVCIVNPKLNQILQLSQIDLQFGWKFLPPLEEVNLIYLPAFVNISLKLCTSNFSGNQNDSMNKLFHFVVFALIRSFLEVVNDLIPHRFEEINFVRANLQLKSQKPLNENQVFELSLKLAKNCMISILYEQPFSQKHFCLWYLSKLNERNLCWEGISQLLVPSEMRIWAKSPHFLLQYTFHFENHHKRMILHLSLFLILDHAPSKLKHNSLYRHKSYEHKDTQLHSLYFNIVVNNNSTPAFEVFPSLILHNYFFSVFFNLMLFIFNYKL